MFKSRAKAWPAMKSGVAYMIGVYCNAKILYHIICITAFIYTSKFLKQAGNICLMFSAHHMLFIHVLVTFIVVVVAIF